MVEGVLVGMTVSLPLEYYRCKEKHEKKKGSSVRRPLFPSAIDGDTCILASGRT